MSQGTSIRELWREVVRLKHRIAAPGEVLNSEAMKLCPGTTQSRAPARTDAVIRANRVVAFELVMPVGEGSSGDGAPILFATSATETGVSRPRRPAAVHGTQ